MFTFRQVDPRHLLTARKKKVFCGAIFQDGGSVGS